MSHTNEYETVIRGTDSNTCSTVMLSANNTHTSVTYLHKAINDENLDKNTDPEKNYLQLVDTSENRGSSMCNVANSGDDDYQQMVDDVNAHRSISDAYEDLTNSVSNSNADNYLQIVAGTNEKHAILASDVYDNVVSQIENACHDTTSVGNTIYNTTKQSDASVGLYSEIQENDNLDSYNTAEQRDASVYFDIPDDNNMGTEYCGIDDATVFSHHNNATEYSGINEDMVYSDMDASPADYKEHNRYSNASKVRVSVSVLGAINFLILAAAGLLWKYLSLTTPSDVASKFAFCATRLQPFTASPGGVVHFDQVGPNDGSAFDGLMFSPTRTGFYWLAASARVTVDSPSSFALVHKSGTKSKQAPDIDGLAWTSLAFTAQHPAFSSTFSLADIRYMEAGDVVYVTSEQPIDDVVTSNAAYSTQDYWSASFMGFSVDGIFSRLVVTKKKTNKTGTTQTTQIDYEPGSFATSNVSYNLDIGNQKIVLSVPESGIYLMTTSVHCSVSNVSIDNFRDTHRSKCFHEPVLVINSSVYYSVSPRKFKLSQYKTVEYNTRAGSLVYVPKLQSSDVFAFTSTLVYLTTSDVLYATFKAEDVSVSFVSHEIQLMLYEPRGNVSANKIAWTVGFDRNNMFSVQIDLGGAINNSNVIIPLAGIYHLMLWIDVPLSPFGQKFAIVRNDIDTVLELVYEPGSVMNDTDFDWMNTFITRERVALVQLASGDVLTFYHNNYTQVEFLRFGTAASFSGFLLYST